MTSLTRTTPQARRRRRTELIAAPIGTAVLATALTGVLAYALGDSAGADMESAVALLGVGLVLGAGLWIGGQIVAARALFPVGRRWEPVVSAVLLSGLTLFVGVGTGRSTEGGGLVVLGAIVLAQLLPGAAFVVADRSGQRASSTPASDGPTPTGPASDGPAPTG